MSESEQFSRTRLLIGDKALEKLKNSRVAVFGVGGVGGYVAEALARAGVVGVARGVRDIRFDDDALAGPDRAHRTRRLEERDVLLVVERSLHDGLRQVWESEQLLVG